jgi:hypothetical protein
MDVEKLKTMLHDVALYNISSHGRVECRTCHGAGSVVYPHGKDLRRLISPCSECHAAKVFKVDDQFARSVHAKNLKDKFTCSTCHDGHVYNIAAKIGDPRQIITQDNTMCLDCHNSDLTFAKFAPVDKRRPNIDQLHSWLPNAQLHWKAVRCVECHTPPTKGFSHEIVNKDQAEKNCVSCHTQETSLRTRLYHHLMQEEQAKFGFVNSAILTNTYIVGATRNP